MNTITIYMKITIDGKTFDMHYSFRMHMLYEEVKEQPMQDVKKFMLKDQAILFYNAVQATLKYNHCDYLMDWDDFCNWVDDNGGEYFLGKFSAWYLKAANKQAAKINELVKEEQEDDSEKKD